MLVYTWKFSHVMIYRTQWGTIIIVFIIKVSQYNNKNFIMIQTTHILVRWWDTWIYTASNREREFLKNDTLMYFIHYTPFRFWNLPFAQCFEKIMHVICNLYEIRKNYMFKVLTKPFWEQLSLDNIQIEVGKNVI